MIVDKIKVLQTPNESKCRIVQCVEHIEQNVGSIYKRFFQWDYWDVTLEGCLKNAVKG